MPANNKNLRNADLHSIEWWYF